MPERQTFRLILAAVAVAATTIGAAPGGPTSAEPAAPKAPLAVAGKPALPNPYKMNMLIRTILIALSQANQTGNYSVLRDLGTMRFQASNTDTRLGEIFADLRQRKLDFSPVLFFDPKLIRQPAIEGEMLRLTGFIPTTPERIVFDMGFELQGEEWRLAAIVIDVQPVAPQTAAQTPAPAAKGKAKPKSSAGKPTTSAAQ